MKYFFLSCLLVSVALSSNAKVWRVNNNVGVTADFTTFFAAVAAAAAGDTLYIEASFTDYTTNSITLTKKLTIIGAGYFHGTNDPSYPANPGLQAIQPYSSLQYIAIGPAAAGTRFLGMILSTINVHASATAHDLLFEKCILNSSITLDNGNHDGITIRKCFFNNGSVAATQGTVVNFVCENNIFFNTWGSLNMTALVPGNNIVRNNSWKDVAIGNTLVNCYVANNIFHNAPNTFTNCTIKNNLFTANQALPGTATNNQINVNITNVYVGGTTGSQDSRAKLKAGSPAIGAGLTVGSVINPDCGAFGATDPYVLSGMPNIPSIYSLTVPTSIPSGSATMNITFSTRNNN